MIHLLAFLLFFNPNATQNSSSEPGDRPKLVVGIVVDQMRTDYIYRYWDTFGDGGFKRMVGEGHFFSNTHFDYVPTYTAPGHASVYTGSNPSVHGIVGNDWFDPNEQNWVYCVQDERSQAAGFSDEEAKNLGGDMSPHRLMSTTITDQLQLATIQKSKVIGISIKDRGAVLPAGQLGDAAYWLDSFGEKFITSTYYMDKPPRWVQKFNKKKPVDKYLEGKWELMLPIERYTSSTEDASVYEGRFRGEDRPIFPRDLKKLSQLNGKRMIASTPFGNSIVADFAIEAVKEEELGQRDVTDFLAVSFSSTDYVGHRYGTMALETQDTYIRLDADLERLFKYLDEKVGKDHYLVFLTADHAGADNPGYLQSMKGNADYMSSRALTGKLRKRMQMQFGDSLVRVISNRQIILDEGALIAKQIDYNEVCNTLKSILIREPGIGAAFTATEIRSGNLTSYVGQKIMNGYHHHRSGDVVFEMQPGWIDYGPTGTTHGAAYTYDTHVPLLFMGWGVKQGETRRRVYVRDIAPTVASMIHVAFPSGATGTVLPEAVK